MTNFRLDYVYQPSTLKQLKKPSLTNISVVVPVSGGVRNSLSKPDGNWVAEQNRMMWKLDDLQPTEQCMLVTSHTHTHTHTTLVHENNTIVKLSIPPLHTCISIHTCISSHPGMLSCSHSLQVVVHSMLSSMWLMGPLCQLLLLFNSSVREPQCPDSPLNFLVMLTKSLLQRINANQVSLITPCLYLSHSSHSISIYLMMIPMLSFCLLTAGKYTAEIVHHY